MANIPFTSNYTDLSSQRGFQFKFFCEQVRQRVHVHVQGQPARHSGGRGECRRIPAGRDLRPGRADRRRAAVDDGRPPARRRARCGRQGDQPALQAVHPLRQMGVRAGLLEQEDGTVRDLRAGPERGDRRGAGDRGQGPGAREGARGGLHRPAGPGPGRGCPLPQLRGQDAGGKFCPECGTPISPKRKCASCGAEASGTPKFCPECGKPYG